MYAVSFCNVNTRGSIKILNDDLSTFSRVDVIGSATGLVTSGQFLYAALKGRSLLKVRLSNLEEIVEKKTDLQDIHSLFVKNNTLFAASTGNDSIFSFRIGDDGSIDGSAKEEFSFKTGVDKHHINSICDFKGEIVFSSFGFKNQADWVSVNHGSVRNLKSEMKFSEVNHPHSLTCKGSDLFYLESKTGELHKNGEKQFRIEGYARGLVVLDDGYLIGVSASRNLGKPSTRGYSTILKTDKHGSILKEIDFQNNKEIYDIIEI